MADKEELKNENVEEENEIGDFGEGGVEMTSAAETDEEEPQKKFSLVEIIIAVTIVALVDAFDALANLSLAIPFLGEVMIVLNFFVGLCATFTIQGWLFIIKKEKGLYNLGGSIIETIPILNVLPIRTAALILTIYFANHPKSKVSSSVRKLSVAKGGVNQAVGAK